MRSYRLLIPLFVLLVLAITTLVITLRSHRHRPNGVLYLDPHAATAKQFTDMLLQHQLRTSVEAYIQVGEKSDAWNGDAMRLLDGYARNAMNLPGAPTEPELTRLGRSILQKGCGDPLILYVYADLLCRMHRETAAILYLRRSTERFSRSKYPRIRCRLAPLRLAQCLEDGAAISRKDEIHRMRTRAIAWTADAMHDGSFLPGESRITLYLLRELQSFYDPHKEELLAKMKAIPGDDPYVMDILEGQYNIQQAWAARGSAVGEKMALARGLLMKAWRQHPDCPEAPTELITVALNDPHTGATPREWFERAIAAQPDYIIAYDNYATSLLPGWGGSYAKMYAFGRECLQTGRFDTQVPLYFYQILDSITKDMNGDRLYWKRPETRMLLETMFQGYERTAQPEEQPRYKSLHAAVDWYYHEYETAMRLLDELGDRIDSRAFNEGFGVNYTRAREEIYTRAKPCGPMIAQAEKLRKTRGVAVARAEYQRILAHGGWSPSLTEILNNRIATLSLQEQFNKGNFTDLFPGQGISGWKPIAGNWTMDKDGTLTGVSTERGLLLISTARFPSRLEMRGEVEFLPQTAMKARCAPGFLAGCQDNGGGGLTLTIDKHAGTAILHKRATAHRADMRAVTVRGRNLLRLLLWDGKVTTYLNGRILHDAVRVAPILSPAAVGLFVDCDEPNVTVKFHRLQIKRLKDEP